VAFISLIDNPFPKGQPECGGCLFMEDPESIESCIFLIRGKKVLLSLHLAALYDVEPRVLIQSINRNSKRFPEDFMFQLTWDEVAALKPHPKFYRMQTEPVLRSQFVILGQRFATRAFYT
jgi:hypothetical protein